MFFQKYAKMKSGKNASSTGIIIEMLKAAGNNGIVFLRELITSVMMNGKNPEDAVMGLSKLS